MRLLMIADDFTGALDAGVQFAKKGFRTRVLVYASDGLGENAGVDILVVDAETRHKTPGEAYKIVFEIAGAAIEAGASYLFKKTDSALRGNVGAELTAVLDAAGEKLLTFVPALPGMNRVTKNGIHYIDGVPAEESVFGADPFEPVTTSNVTELIHRQSGVNVQTVSGGRILTEASEKTIAVYDCTSDEEMTQIAANLKAGGSFRLMAGCAGFAEMVPGMLGSCETKGAIPVLPQHFLVVCGSVNPITVKQLEYAQRHGFVRIGLAPEQKLEKEFLSTSAGKALLDRIWDVCCSSNKVILDTNDPRGSSATAEYAGRLGISLDEVRIRIAATLGKIVENLVERGLDSSLLMTGGDTLLGYIQLLEGATLTPVGEIERGIVLSELIAGRHRTYVITKSGGFGDETLLTDMAEKICPEKKETGYWRKK